MTEDTLMTDMKASVQKLMALKRLGIRTSIDDFGTGYSSFFYLKWLPVDKLKIDPSFVWDIAQDPNGVAITGAIIAMGKQLNLKVIAEGVEDLQAERFLLKHRCDQMQGYLFSPPIPADVFAGMLAIGATIHGRKANLGHDVVLLWGRLHHAAVAARASRARFRERQARHRSPLPTCRYRRPRSTPRIR